MKNTGVIRKIDDLGRIVIPKEIRNNLNIKSFDDLEIYVESNKIVLNKISTEEFLKSNSKLIIDSTSDLVDIKIYITDKEKVITNGDLENKKLDNKLLEILNDRMIVNKNITEVYFNKTGYFYILPIINNSDIKGLLILYKKTLFNKEEEFLGKVLKNIIENK